MNISLTPELEKFVAQEVQDGFYKTASEVVRAALRRLKEANNAQISSQPQTLAELEQRLLEGIERLDHGEGIDGEEMFRRLHKRFREAGKNA